MTNPEENIKNLTDDVEKLVYLYSLGRDRAEGSNNFLRVKIPNGIVTTAQFREIASIAEKYGKGYAEITDKQNIQIHWIQFEEAIDIFKKLKSIGFTTDRCGQGFPTARYGDVRNVVGCAAAGADVDELIDASPIALQLHKFFTGNKEFVDLPKKFKISVSSCSLNCTCPEAQDLAFVAHRHPTEKIGFVTLVGGTVGSSPQIARQLGIFIKPDEVIEVAKAIVEIFRDFGSRESKGKARFRWLVDAWGVEKVRCEVEKKLGRKLQAYVVEQLPRCRGEHIGVKSQKKAGYSYIGVPVISGILSTQKMLKLADIVDQYGNGTLRLSAHQNIIFTNVPNEKVDSALEELAEADFPVKGSCFRWTTVACAGNFCGKSSDNPKKRALETVAYLDELFGSIKDLNVRLSFSGCPNGCSRHLVADIGLQANRLIVDGKPELRYNIYVAESSQGENVLGKLVMHDVKADQLKSTVGILVENNIDKKRRTGNL
jgi:sulfite reductase beta subunit-like hemoprotein